MDYKNLEHGYQELLQHFPHPAYHLSMVHGKMKNAEKDGGMQKFVSGKAQIMVATTVIEVGVNVPNASVMIIESSERFGLSQLHQLRGRVGRGAEQSYCILMTGDKLSSDARQRIKALCDTNNGFEIAELDLQLRGPGELEGKMQSGVLDLRIADLAKDQPLLMLARQEASDILQHDPKLQLPQHLPLANTIRKHSPDNRWGKIS
jgi:ATP-dependent DNA helicase RecG